MSRIPGDALGPRSPPPRRHDNGTGGGSPFGRDADSPGAGWAWCDDAFCGDGCQHPAVPYLGDGRGESLYDTALSGGGSQFSFDENSPLPKNDGEDAASPNSSAWSAVPPPPPPRSQLRNDPRLRIPVLDGDALAPAPAPGRRRPVRTSWKCAWCPQTEGKKQRGPDGPRTLCKTCNTRWKQYGETGPRSADWKCGWGGADDSMTPRRRKGPKGPGTLCESCGSSFCRGATGPPAEDWCCDWCQETTGRRRPGPKGPATLCGPCGLRFRKHGETGPRSADWKCDQCGADDSRTTRCKGPNGPATACSSCSMKWVRSKRRRRAEPDHLAEAFARRPVEPAPGPVLAPRRGQDVPIGARQKRQFARKDGAKLEMFRRIEAEREAERRKSSTPQERPTTRRKKRKSRGDDDGLPEPKRPSRRAPPRPRKARVDDDVAAALLGGLGAGGLERVRRAVEGLIPAAPELDRSAKDAIAAAAKEAGTRDGGLKKDLKKALKKARATAGRELPPRDDDSDDDGPSPVDAILRGLVPNAAALRHVINLRGALLKALKVEAADGNFMNITGAKGAAQYADGSWRYFEAASCNRGALMETSAVLLFATALVFAGRIERGRESYLASLVSVSGQPAPCALDAALKMICPCDEVRDRLDSPAGVRAVEWLVNCVDARCQSADVAWRVLADEGLNAFNHAEPMVLMQSLLGESTPVYVTIVSFGRPACARCDRFFSLLGTVRASTDVPVALCPRGISPNDITEKSGIIDIIAAAA